MAKVGLVWCFCVPVDKGVLSTQRNPPRVTGLELVLQDASFVCLGNTTYSREGVAKKQQLPRGLALVFLS
jgi:hypothetical protein